MWRRLIIGRALSILGNSITAITLRVRAYGTAAGLPVVAAVALAELLPRMLVSPLSGIVADRGTQKANPDNV